MAKRAGKCVKCGWPHHPEDGSTCRNCVRNSKLRNEAEEKVRSLTERAEAAEARVKGG